MDYLRFASLAQRLIDKNGRAVKLRKLAKGAADPSKPWNGTGAAPAVEWEVSTKAVFVDPKGSDIKSLVKDDEMLKRITDVALVAPQEQDLSLATTLIDNEACAVEWVQVLKPGPTVCLYVIGVAR